jgi:hypothetical protein
VGADASWPVDRQFIYVGFCPFCTGPVASSSGLKPQGLDGTLCFFIAAYLLIAAFLEKVYRVESS